LYELQDLVFYGASFTLLILLITNAIVPQEEPSFLQAEAQQKHNNTITTTEMTNMTNSIIPQAREVNEANSELIKICVSAPNSECDNTMIIIHNDCIAYPAYVATHIPSCDDSRLISYLITRGLLE
jgi:hypothetical protein